jgi:hypothetical protein
MFGVVEKLRALNAETQRRREKIRREIPHFVRNDEREKQSQNLKRKQVPPFQRRRAAAKRTLSAKTKPELGMTSLASG